MWRGHPHVPRSAGHHAGKNDDARGAVADERAHAAGGGNTRRAKNPASTKNSVIRNMWMTKKVMPSVRSASDRPAATVEARQVRHGGVQDHAEQQGEAAHRVERVQAGVFGRHSPSAQHDDTPNIRAYTSGDKGGDRHRRQNERRTDLPHHPGRQRECTYGVERDHQARCRGQAPRA